MKLPDMSAYQAMEIKFFFRFRSANDNASFLIFVHDGEEWKYWTAVYQETVRYENKKWYEFSSFYHFPSDTITGYPVKIRIMYYGSAAYYSSQKATFNNMDRLFVDTFSVLGYVGL